MYWLYPTNSRCIALILAKFIPNSPGTDHMHGNSTSSTYLATRLIQVPPRLSIDLCVDIKRRISLASHLSTVSRAVYLRMTFAHPFPSGQVVIIRPQNSPTASTCRGQCAPSISRNNPLNTAPTPSFTAVSQAAHWHPSSARKAGSDTNNAHMSQRPRCQDPIH